VSEIGTQGICAGCSRTFSSRSRVLGKQKPVQYLQQTHLVDAWQCNKSEEISGRRGSNWPTDYYHGFDEPIAMLAAILSDAEIWDLRLREQQAAMTWTTGDRRGWNGGSLMESFDRHKFVWAQDFLAVESIADQRPAVAGAVIQTRDVWSQRSFDVLRIQPVVAEK
jgi:hypothetical protein